MAKQELLSKVTAPDGSLHAFGEGGYLAWKPDEERITIDGEFTAAQLREIAKHMDSHCLTVVELAKGVRLG